MKVQETCKAVAAQLNFKDLKEGTVYRNGSGQIRIKVAYVGGGTYALNPESGKFDGYNAASAGDNNLVKEILDNATLVLNP